MTVPYDYIRYCVCCNSSDLHPYLDLREVPPPNSFYMPDEPPPAAYPLKVDVCKRCWHSQISVAVDPKVLFCDYLYRTGVSETLRKHYADLAGFVYTNYVEHGKPFMAIDIGCNDMTLLQAFEGFNDNAIIGVDPTDAVGHLDSSYSARLVQGFWGQRRTTNLLIDKIVSRPMVASSVVITATNVFAHQQHPARFLHECSRILDIFAADGVLVLEFPYSLNLLQNNEFDTIYHEHISYFTVHSMLALLDGLGWYVDYVALVRVHGGSIRFVLRQCEVGSEAKLHCPAARNMIVTEGQSGLLNPHSYLGYQARIDYIRVELRAAVAAARTSGHKVIGFGASGKSTVLLNYCGIDLEYLVDETPDKRGRLSPGRGIPIKPLEHFVAETGDLFVLALVWNCLPESLAKIGLNEAASSITWATHVPEFHQERLR